MALPERLTIKDTIQQWVDKINRLFDKTVGNFEIIEQNGLTMTLNFGFYRDGSEVKIINETSLTFVDQNVTRTVGINKLTEAVEQYEYFATPTSDFLPLYQINTANGEIYIVYDFTRTLFLCHK